MPICQSTSIKTFNAIASQTVTELPDNSFILQHVGITFANDGSGLLQNTLVGQKFNADGAPAGQSVSYYSFPVGKQGFREIVSTSLDNDNIFVVGRYGADNYPTDVQGIKFTESGNIIGSVFNISTASSGADNLKIIKFTDDSFAVKWVDSLGLNIKAFAADGDPASNQVAINSSGDISASNDNMLLNAYIDQDNDYNDNVYIQKLSKDGTAIVVNPLAITSNTNYENDFYKPLVSSLSDGGALITWINSADSLITCSIYGQKVDSDLSLVGNSYTIMNDFLCPGFLAYKVTPLSTSDTWVATVRYPVKLTETSGTASNLFAQKFQTDGTLVGSKIQITNITGNGVNEQFDTKGLNDVGVAFFWSQISPLGVALGSEYAGDGSCIDINMPSPLPSPSSNSFPSASPKHNGGGNNDLGSADSLFANNWVAQVSEFFDF